MAKKLTVTVEECREILVDAGISIGYEKLVTGIRCGTFPEFSRCIDMRKEDGHGNYEYIIFKNDLLNFIESHGGNAGARND